ncbi:DUF2339 domain-containing protein [bacterium SCSIO 12741]|nr:DUF2339 domain-containing protein [bacterium SCSIO 12741]
MADNPNRIEELRKKLDALLRQQAEFSQSVEEIKRELDRLQWAEPEPAETVDPDLKSDAEPVETPIEDPAEEPTQEEKSETWEKEPEPVPLLNLDGEKGMSDWKVGKRPMDDQAEAPKTEPVKAKRSNLEKFVGENLINKIGIVITVIGVAIGVKYSIDHDLINPLTRVIMAFFVGIGLIGVGFKLKNKYHNYSAVLVSGAMAIIYFDTYAAYDFYDFIPRMLAFALMVIYTGFTVFTAIHYNRQIIAHIGLVGAYAVPFLLSNNSGQVEILFTYMALINAGILVIAIRRYWKALYVVAFVLTWLIYSSWAVIEMRSGQDWIALVFGFVFFAIFYATFLGYKLLKKEKFQYSDIAWVSVNSFLFFGFGYMVLDDHSSSRPYLGLFTLLNGVIHFVVAWIIYRRKQGDRNLFYMITGMVLLFLTLAIPVQLDGNWVTLLWIGQASLLFTLGRKRKIPFYEGISYLLMMLAFASLLEDWGSTYIDIVRQKDAEFFMPVFNVQMLSSLLFVGCLAWINRVHLSKHVAPSAFKDITLKSLLSYGLPGALVITLFASFFLEIGYFFDRLYWTTSVENPLWPDSPIRYLGDEDIRGFKSLWLLHYSLIFASIFTWVNLRWYKKMDLGMVNVIINGFLLLLFLTTGLYELSELRESYLRPAADSNFIHGPENMMLRYLSIVLIAGMLWITHRLLKQPYMKLRMDQALEIVVHGTILWVLSSELLTWMDVGGVAHNYKLGLSILSGCYSALLVGFGIWKKKRHLRIAAMVWFAVILIKLVFYDIAHLNTLAKTVVFVSLGILLLIMSFLYNKYKQIIFPDE